MMFGNLHFVYTGLSAPEDRGYMSYYPSHIKNNTTGMKIETPILSKLFALHSWKLYLQITKKEGKWQFCQKY
jgi:hypothetical protein